jgi:ankyrin repeat protein
MVLSTPYDLDLIEDSDGKSLLCLALDNGDVAAARLLSSKICTKGEEFQLLSAAVKAGVWENIELVLSVVAPVDDDSFAKVLKVACASSRLDILRRLLSLRPDTCLDLPFMEACERGQLDTVSFLLGAGADINCCFNFPLILAARAGHDAVVEALLAAGAVVPDGDRTAYVLEDAAKGGCLVLGRRLLTAHRHAVHVLDRALAAAAKGGHVQVIGALIAAGANVSVSAHRFEPLLDALAGGHPEAARLLLSRGPGLRGLSPADLTTLLMAALAGNCGEIATEMVAQGADVNGICYGACPLSMASEPAMVRLLLDAGATAAPQKSAAGAKRPARGGKAPGKRTKSVMQMACERLRPDAVRLLLDAGAVPSVAALATALEPKVDADREPDRIRVVTMLLDANAPLGGTSSRDPAIFACVRCPGASAAELAGLVLDRDPAQLAAENEDGWTPLEEAALAGKEALVELLLRRGADVHRRNDSDQTVLLSTYLYDAPYKLNILRRLLLAGADVHAVDDIGRTLLFHWVLRGEPGRQLWAGLRLLMAAGADVMTCDNADVTTLMALMGDEDAGNDAEAVLEGLLGLLAEEGVQRRNVDYCTGIRSNL